MRGNGCEDNPSGSFSGETTQIHSIPAFSLTISPRTLGCRFMRVPHPFGCPSVDMAIYNPMQLFFKTSTRKLAPTSCWNLPAQFVFYKNKLQRALPRQRVGQQCRNGPLHVHGSCRVSFSFHWCLFSKFSSRTKDVLVLQTTAKSIFKVRQTSLCSCYVFCLHKYVNYQKLCQRSREVVRYVAAHTRIHMPYKGFYPFQFLQCGVLDLKVCKFHGTDAEWRQWISRNWRKQGGKIKVGVRIKSSWPHICGNIKSKDGEVLKQNHVLYIQEWFSQEN